MCPSHLLHKGRSVAKTTKKTTAKKAVPFEQSKRDVEKRGVKEGSKADMRMDARQQKRGKK